MTTALWIIAICEMVRMIQSGIQLYTILTERDKREICYDEILKSVSLPDEEIAERLMRKWEEDEDGNFFDYCPDCGAKMERSGVSDEF